MTQLINSTLPSSIIAEINALLSGGGSGSIDFLAQSPLAQVIEDFNATKDDTTTTSTGLVPTFKSLTGSTTTISVAGKTGTNSAAATATALTGFTSILTNTDLMHSALFVELRAGTLTERPAGTAITEPSPDPGLPSDDPIQIAFDLSLAEY
ncbi:MAG: hypothetical protein QF926_05740 [Alphaproteobacteria bacterium]|jgi:hypothetical protein|nr:hypothetical protein [Alphaproteobacteria bacterium]MDP6516109.1 hypothetical protein [Alphaproteobacteria bacterium]